MGDIVLALIFFSFVGVAIWCQWQESHGISPRYWAQEDRASASARVEMHRISKELDLDLHAHEVSRQTEQLKGQLRDELASLRDQRHD